MKEDTSDIILQKDGLNNSEGANERFRAKTAAVNKCSNVIK